MTSRRSRGRPAHARLGLLVLRHTGRGEVGVEEHVATPGLVQVLAQGQLLHQGADAVILGLVLQVLQVDLLEGQRPVAEIVEYVSKQMGISVDEYCTLVIFVRLYPSTEQAREECVLDLHINKTY